LLTAVPFMRQKFLSESGHAGRWPAPEIRPLYAKRKTSHYTRRVHWPARCIAAGRPQREGTAVSTQTVRLHRWDEIALEKVTEMISRKIVTGEREMLAQIYLKKGALVPMHSHESEQMTYVLQGALKFLIAGEEITVREGEVLHIPSWVEHQAEALDDTFELDVFSPIRQDWLDHTDSYFHLPSQGPA
jgi:quercetin dioxygenase-like cupin family protein